MIGLIPEQYRVAACAAVALVALAALAGAAATGAAVNGWRLDAAHQRVLAEQRQAYDELASRVREQNQAVETAHAASVAAEQRRATAEKFAATAIERSNARASAVAASTATDCAGVLGDAWKGWK